MHLHSTSRRSKSSWKVAVRTVAYVQGEEAAFGRYVRSRFYPIMGQTPRLASPWLFRRPMMPTYLTSLVGHSSITSATLIKWPCRRGLGAGCGATSPCPQRWGRANAPCLFQFIYLRFSSSWLQCHLP